MSHAEMSQEPIDWTATARYLAGESTADEAAAVERWLAAHPSDAAVISALDAALKQPATANSVDVEEALRKVKARAAQAPPDHRKRNIAFFTAAVAAAAAAFVMLSPNRSGRERPTNVASREYSTGVGARDSVTLADGSRVLLGPDSRIIVGNRDVQLQGEAYFTVVHDAARPFVVRAGDAIIRDIGTEFAVHHDRDEPVRVAVHEGSVQLIRDTQSVTLRKGDVGVVRNNRMDAQRGAASDEDFAWTRGRLVFRDASVAELAADLRRWYGVEVRVSDSTLLKRHFTGSFVNEPSNRVLDVIALALGARVERRGDTAYIRKTTTSR